MISLSEQKYCESVTPAFSPTAETTEASSEPWSELTVRQHEANTVFPGAMNLDHVSLDEKSPVTSARFTSRWLPYHWHRYEIDVHADA
jgi:hypothetical protein